MTMQEIEAMLDAGQLSVRMANGRAWKLRRNGKTRTWKRNPDRWEIPVKAGLKSCGRLSNQSVVVGDVVETC